MSVQHNDSRNESTLSRLSRLPIARLLMIGMLILVLQLPLMLISSQIYERDAQRHHAVDDVTQRWGRAQTLIGPFIIVPYHSYTQRTDVAGKPYRQQQKLHAAFLPQNLTIDSRVQHQTRQRGLFDIPLYESQLQLSGGFKRPDFKRWHVQDSDILWQEAELILLISDAHAIQEHITLDWDKQPLRFEPGTGRLFKRLEGFHLPLSKLPQRDHTPFNISLQLNGSQQLYFAPLGNDNTIQMQSDWPNPSFSGKWLPSQHRVAPDGFTSRWQIASISRGYPEQWLLQGESADDHIQTLQNSTVGVDFLAGIDHYRLSERSIKYDMLFLFLTFLVVWVIEIVSKQRVHFIQYLLLGAALCLFYLLLLALSEHIGFYFAYLLASLGVIAMVGLYSWAVLRTGKRATIMTVLLVALYTYLFSLLHEQTYALLIGAIGIFIALGITMYLTRKTDWYQLGKSTPP